MKLQKKIGRSMLLMIILTLVVSYLATTIIVYRQTIDIVENELEQEADYMIAAMEMAGEDYLAQIDAVRRPTRVTLIDENGTVLYDYNEAALQENHKSRPEVISAMKTGEGRDIRRSSTLNKDMVYYAKELKDGRIFRVSKSVDTAFILSLRVLPYIGIIVLIMALIAWRLSKRQVAKIIEPINKMDVENPLHNEIYEELTPLLVNMDEQIREKELVAKMRREFTANVSHELKTPLTSISGYAEIMKDGIVRPEDMQNFSERIYKEASSLISLIDDVIKLSRLDEERVVKTEPVDLFQLSHGVITRLTPLAKKSKVRLELTGEPVEIMGDYRILDEMITNLVENGIKYNREGGSVAVWVGKTLQGVRISVSDTGIGIPKDQHERIFERFYRVDKSHSKEVPGTGLGLSIVKHGAALHKMGIFVESEEGKGTTIILGTEYFK
ncbi:sensor histidine kinase [Ohessyouella blattaphilus]|uniref:histidine kinase n=1 Tax=Ohessyouella blattaphilus TaxID=2949333 RepID=A0ABT1EGR1_9FIRM|nr:ATP-binding protein [Ohessyouella blattaphilus]MCP1108871.1 ATP-binding protein [Ohessyouella blattaphilus]MCR8562265.1 ATP-binding protein [Ohessyouella blattaphilus]